MNELLQKWVWVVFVLFRKAVGRKYYARSVRLLLEAGKDVFILDEDLVFGTTVSPFGFTIMVSARDRVVGRSIVEKGKYESHFTDHFCSFLTRETRFVDIGANIGYYSLLAASRCPGGRVCSFEPDRHNYALLKRSVERNGFGPVVEAHPYAVSDQNETLIISDLGSRPNFGARFTAKSREELDRFASLGEPGVREVQAVKLDDFLRDRPVDLIKMDIEGFEPYALRGMRELLERNRPVLFLEFAPVNLEQFGKSTPEAFLEDLISRGYEIRVIRKKKTLSFGNDVRGILAHFRRVRKQHIDLILTPR